MAAGAEPRRRPRFARAGRAGVPGAGRPRPGARRPGDRGADALGAGPRLASGRASSTCARTSSNGALEDLQSPRRLSDVRCLAPDEALRLASPPRWRTARGRPSSTRRRSGEQFRRSARRVDASRSSSSAAPDGDAGALDGVMRIAPDREVPVGHCVLNVTSSRCRRGRMLSRPADPYRRIARSSQSKLGPRTTRTVADRNPAGAKVAPIARRPRRSSTSRNADVERARAGRGRRVHRDVARLPAVLRDPRDRSTRRVRLRAGRNVTTGGAASPSSHERFSHRSARQWIRRGRLGVRSLAAVVRRRSGQDVRRHVGGQRIRVQRRRARRSTSPTATRRLSLRRPTLYVCDRPSRGNDRCASPPTDTPSAASHDRTARRRSALARRRPERPRPTIVSVNSYGYSASRTRCPGRTRGAASACTTRLSSVEGCRRSPRRTDAAMARRRHEARAQASHALAREEEEAHEAKGHTRAPPSRAGRARPRRVRHLPRLGALGRLERRLRRRLDR